MASGMGGPARPKAQWTDAPAWSMGTRIPWQIVPAEQLAHPGPGQYNLAPRPQVRLPNQRKGFSRDRKATYSFPAEAQPSRKDLQQSPGPGAYIIRGEFERIPHRNGKGLQSSKKDTMAAFGPNWKDAAQSPGPGAYIIPSTFLKSPRQFAPPAQRSSRVLQWARPQAKAPATGEEGHQDMGTPSGAGDMHDRHDSPYGNLVSNMQWTYDAPARKSKSGAAAVPLYAKPTAASTAKVGAPRAGAHGTR